MGFPLGFFEFYFMIVIVWNPGPRTGIQKRTLDNVFSSEFLATSTLVNKETSPWWLFLKEKETETDKRDANNDAL